MHTCFHEVATQIVLPIRNIIFPRCFPRTIISIWYSYTTKILHDTNRIFHLYLNMNFVRKKFINRITNTK